MGRHSWLAFVWALFLVSLLEGISFGAGEEVVVVGTRTPNPVKELPVSVSVIEREEVEESAAQSVSELLRYVPGIFVRDDDIVGLSSWRTTFRGLSVDSGYALVLVDGSRVRGEGMGDSGIGLNQIPPQMIERIEVLRGAGSVIYGNDAVAGVINVVTKDVPERPTYGFELGYGSRASNTQYVFLGAPKPLGFFFQAAREESDVGQYGVKSSRAETYERKTLLLKTLLTNSTSFKFGISFRAEEQLRTLDYRTQDTFVLKRFYKYAVSPFLRFSDSKGRELRLKVYYYDWRMKMDEAGSDPYPYALYNGDMYYRTAELLYSSPVGLRNIVTVGVEYRAEVLDYTFSERTLETYRAFLQNEFKGKRLNLVAGLSYNHHTTYGEEVCPRAGLVVKLGSLTRLKVYAGKAFKSPTIRQAFYTEPYPHKDYFYVSNPDLEAETSWNYSLGLDVYPYEGAVISITAFRNDVTNMIVDYYTKRDINGNGTLETIRTFENSKEAYTQGLELYTSLKVKRRFKGSLGYTYLVTKDEETDKEIPLNPRHNLFLSASLRDFFLKGLTLWVGVQYVSEMYKDADNTEKTDPYWVVDLKLVKNLSKHLSVSLEGNNIFNSDYGDPERTWVGSTWFLKLSSKF